MSEYKLAGTLKSTVAVAKQLITDYFTTFPKIGVILNYFGRFGINNGYIQTIYPFFRKRHYPEWQGIPDYVKEAHISKIQYNKVLGSIERQSKNHPVQGSGADMIKYAMVLIRRFIKTNGLWDDVKLLLQVHDEQVTSCIDEKTEWWKPELTRLMEEAAFRIIPNGLLKSDTHITARWQK